MKKLLMLMLALAFIMLTACQPTPDAPFVESKNDGQLEAALNGTPAAEGRYQAPKSWNDSLSDDAGFMNVNINASITVPEASAYPVYKVDNPPYTNDDAVHFINAMLNGRKLYTVGNYRTKAVIEQEIQNVEAQRAPGSRMDEALRSGELSQEEYDYYIAQDNEKLAKLRKEYKSAPMDMGYTEAKLELTPDTEHFSGYSEGSILRIRGITQDDNCSYVDVITSNVYPRSGWQTMCYINRAQPDFLYSMSPFLANQVYGESTDCSAQTGDIEGAAMTYNEAQTFAEDIVYQKLGFNNYKLMRVMSQSYFKLGADEACERYVFIYTPTIDGIPMLHYSMNSHNIDQYMWPEYSSGVALYIADKDNYDVYVQSNTTTTDNITDNVPLLPFDNIKEVFKKYVLLNANHSGGVMEQETLEHVDINISDVRLGYVRIIEKNNVESGILVPAWCFYGDETVKIKKEFTDQLVLDESGEIHYVGDPGNAFLCINAIDGSIIDLDKGY